MLAKLSAVSWRVYAVILGVCLVVGVANLIVSLGWDAQPVAMAPVGFWLSTAVELVCLFGLMVSVIYLFGRTEMLSYSAALIGGLALLRFVFIMGTTPWTGNTLALGIVGVVFLIVALVCWLQERSENRRTSPNFS